MGIQKKSGRKTLDGSKKKYTPKQAVKILQAYNRRQGIQTLLEPTFSSQTEFIQDGCKLKAALCTRRAGKSYGIGLYLFQEALSEPCTCVYVALTRESAKRIMWNPILRKIDRQHSIAAVFKEVELSVHLPNGSIIYLIGLNSTSEEQEKLLGGGYKLVCIDECASFTQDLREIVYGTIKPAMADYNGTICLIGTPGNLIQMRKTSAFGAALANGQNDQIATEFSEAKLQNNKPLFYSVTSGEESGWSVHKWSALDNPFMKDKWIKEVDELVKRNPLVKETPLFKQHYLGEWYVDTNKLVYKYNADYNSIDGLPAGEYTYLLGIDLGYTDASAFVVVAYSKHDDCLYIVHAYKKREMSMKQVEKVIRDLMIKYPISKFIIDTKGRQFVEELRARTHLPLEAAEQTSKIEFIHFMNSDLIGGKVKVLPAANSLVEEWGALIWNERNGVLAEHKACENHLTDAALYAWRYSFNYLAQKENKLIITKDSEEWMEDWWDKQANKIKSNKRKNWMEKDWGEFF